MTAQLANGGYKIIPRIIDDGKSLEPIFTAWKQKFEEIENNNIRDSLQDSFKFKKYYLLSLANNPENVKFVKDALFGATNEPRGTSYSSRYTNSKYIYAGKTGTSQVRKFTDEQRELKVKYTDISYEERDHALFSAFAPYKKPKYAISVIIEHGGSGSSVAAPIAKKLIKKIIDRDELRRLRYGDIFV